MIKEALPIATLDYALLIFGFMTTNPLSNASEGRPDSWSIFFATWDSWGQYLHYPCITSVVLEVLVQLHKKYLN